MNISLDSGKAQAVSLNAQAVYFTEEHRYSIEKSVSDCLWNEPMSLHTSIGVGGEAACMAFPSGIKELKDILKIAYSENIPCYVVGKGTNLLVADKGYLGIIINLSKGFNTIAKQDSDDRIFLKAGAGVPMQRLMRYCIKHGLSGIEFLAGIPGSIGGGIAMNAGINEFEVMDYVTDISIVRGLDIKTIQRRDIDAGYRTLSLDSMDIIIEAGLSLKKDDPAAIAGRMRKLIGKRRLTQPFKEKNCGCIFRNPKGYSAGKLIDEAGLKGKRMGNAQISEKHANFIINLGGATCSDIKGIIECAIKRVEEAKGIHLHPEAVLLEMEGPWVL